MAKMISIKLILKRTLVILLFALSFGVNLYVYNDNSETITHYKPYYAKSYLYAAQEALSLNGSVSAQSLMSAKSVPVLVYHGVVENPDKTDVNTTLETFKNQMFVLKSQGWRTVRLNEFNQYIQGKEALPDKSFLLTFDDGRKDSFYPVEPILEALDYSAVMFVITSTLSSESNNFHLTKHEIEKMIKTGRWDIQTHTYLGHGKIVLDAKGTQGLFYSNKKWLPDKNRLETNQEFHDRISYDLARAKSDLKTYFGIDSIAFAFPFNDYAREPMNYPDAGKVFNAEVQKDYRLLFYQVDPGKGLPIFNHFGSKEQMIKRLDVDAAMSEKDLLNILNQERTNYPN